MENRKYTKQVELDKIITALARIGTGSKKALAEYLGIEPSNITRYLKYGDIPLDRLRQIKTFIKLNS